MSLKKTASGASIWSVYLVVCADGSLYTGVAKDVPARVERHNQGLGAKYTRGRRPVELLFSEAVGDHGQALRREYAIKQLPREKKIALIAGNAVAGNPYKLTGLRDSPQRRQR
jgi:predicted GIY-YIG superfamily endonuclease